MALTLCAYIPGDDILFNVLPNDYFKAFYLILPLVLPIAGDDNDYSKGFYLI